MALRLSEWLGHACTVGGRLDEGGSGAPYAKNGAAGCFSALQMPENEAMRPLKQPSATQVTEAPHLAEATEASV